ncbi:MAG: chromosomal replication initiator protein DnaA [Gemmatimonadaceae bacterium]|nr:chromosomal replication initiator protein DnaA [Gemmatimonadaceae bacterium]
MTLSASDAWSRILDRARDHLPAHTIDQWLAPLAALEFDGQQLTLAAPDQFAVDWVSSKHSQYLESLAPICLGHPCKLVFKVQDERRTRSQMDLFVPQVEATIEPVSVDNTVILSQLNDRYSFEHFVIGKSNELAAAAAAAVAEAPGTTYNPLFIYGSTGLGKTHLMQAIAHRIIERNPNTRVTYITAEQFLNDVINSIETRSMNEFKRRYRQSDLLLVDDVHVLAGKQQTQEEFFHTFNALYEAGRQIVLTSDRPPSEIPRLEDRLKSRFQWGMVADVSAPDLEHRIAILRRKAQMDHLEHTIPDEVLHFIADHVQANVRELEGSIIKLLAYSSLRHRVVTVDLAREALRDKLRAAESAAPVRSTRQDKVVQIQQAVASEWGVTVDGLTSKTRTKVLTVPRQVAMYLTREIHGLQLVEIGAAFGGRDHSTVIHSLERVAEMVKEDTGFRGRVEKVRESVRHTQW